MLNVDISRSLTLGGRGWQVHRPHEWDRTPSNPHREKECPAVETELAVASCPIESAEHFGHEVIYILIDLTRA